MAETSRIEPTIAPKSNSGHVSFISLVIPSPRSSMIRGASAQPHQVLHALSDQPIEREVHLDPLVHGGLLAPVPVAADGGARHAGFERQLLVRDARLPTFVVELAHLI